MSTETHVNRRLPTPEQIERQGRALELRAAKLTFPQIADELGCSLSYAHTLVMKGMKFYLADRGAESERAEMLGRLNLATAAVMPRVMRGDDKAIDRYLRLEQRRADLLGLDAPKTVNLRGEVKVVSIDALDAEIARLADAVGRNPANAARDDITGGAVGVGGTGPGTGPGNAVPTGSDLA